MDKESKQGVRDALVIIGGVLIGAGVTMLVISAAGVI